MNIVVKDDLIYKTMRVTMYLGKHTPEKVHSEFVDALKTFNFNFKIMHMDINGGTFTATKIDYIIFVNGTTNQIHMLNNFVLEWNLIHS